MRITGPGVWGPPKDVNTAIALAKAGFVAAALTHNGDSWRDNSNPTAIWQRPRQLKVLIDYLLGAWHDSGRIDADRVRHDERDGFSFEFASIPRIRTIVAVVHQLVRVLVSEDDELCGRCKAGDDLDVSAARGP